MRMSKCADWLTLMQGAINNGNFLEDWNSLAPKMAVELTDEEIAYVLSSLYWGDGK